MILAMVLAAALGVDGRDAPRLHWEAAFSGTAIRGVGGHFELGAVFDDRHVLALRADIATIVVIGTYQIGTSFAEWLNDWLTLGVGATFALHNGFGEPAFYVGAQFPVRATVLLMPRKLADVARSGLTLGLEASPGFWMRQNSVEGPGLGFSMLGVVSIGWACW